MDDKVYEEIEQLVSDREASYKGLKQEALLTSKEDFKAIFSALPHIETWIEPGSGHGLGPLLFAQLHPNKASVGVEFEKSRFDYSVKTKERIGLENVEFIHADLLKFDLPPGDAYFLYFPTGMVLDRILNQLGCSERPLSVVAIESHGDLLPRLEKEPWLKKTLEVPLADQRHYPYAVVFKKVGQISPSLHSVSFLQKHLLIEEDNGEKWLGESFGLEWSRNDEFNLLHPPRTIKASQVRETFSIEELDKEQQFVLALRRSGYLRIETESGEFSGYLRKIFVSPCFKVEISTGQQLEWSQIKKIFWENTLCYESLSGYYFFPHVV